MSSEPPPKFQHQEVVLYRDQKHTIVATAYINGTRYYMTAEANGPVIAEHELCKPGITP